jgi:hypothetical protein
MRWPASSAIGSTLAAVFVALAGGRGAFALVAAGLPVATLLVFRHLFAADARALPVVEIARLRALPIFAPLGAPALEGLARELVPVEAPAGTTIVAEGETGDRFYVVVDGDLSRSLATFPARRLCRR